MNSVYNLALVVKGSQRDYGLGPGVLVRQEIAFEDKPNTSPAILAASLLNASDSFLRENVEVLVAEGPIEEEPAGKKPGDGPFFVAAWIASALMPLAQLDVAHLSGKPDTYPIFGLNDTTLTLGDVRRARRVLETGGWTWRQEEE